MNDDYMGNEHLCDAILGDIKKWTGEKQKEIEKSARKIQNQIKQKLEETTPVENYPYNNGVKMEIVVQRRKKIKAIKAHAERQPGLMKSGWTKATLKNKDKKYVIGVRNKAVPSLVHLVNFDHRVVAHKKDTGVMYHGSHFVDKVQEWGQKEFEKEIEKILNK